ncbi:MAG: phenylalanyl-tRNA synthetase alpha chain [Gaiellaceae bacterium]|nr:phenylalanyl-tRNA synthetase alpha chain [Gaiellaceae bacterium]
MTDDLDRLVQEARDRIGGASRRAALEEARVSLLGRNAELTQRLRGIAGLPPEERGPVGKRLNEVRQTIEVMLQEREAAVGERELAEQLERERVDVTLPGSVVPRGGLHLLTQTRREIEDIFIGLGYTIAEGPEIELEYNNFAALNFSDDHPAKAETDTLWIAPGVLLRTHTSPVQARTLRTEEPPIYVIVPGRVYRRDTPDATHSPIFHQVEGLVVDRGITLADLKGTLAYVARELFGADRETRFRTSFFPFTEPSVEVDVSCFLCDGAGCGVCKHSGWIEILGAGQVDPNVLEMAGLDTAVWQGFAFGMGIERIAFLKYGFPDLRMLYDNDLRFLEQFPS